MFDGAWIILPENCTDLHMDNPMVYGMNQQPCMVFRMGEGDVLITGMEEMRKNLRETVSAAAERGEHVVVRRHGQPIAVLVPVSWYVAKGGDPRGPLPTAEPH
jgi:hypothetical protein